MNKPTDQAAQDFYSMLRYPGPDALVTTIYANRIKPFIDQKRFRFLDAGCGSGRHTAGMLKTYPEASGVALDISGPSVAAARTLAETLGFAERVRFQQASYSEPLNLGEQFDVALAIGTIHHSPDAYRSLKNIAATVKPGGIVAGMVYSKRANDRRYEIKEMLSLLQPDDIAARIPLHRAYSSKYLNWLDRTPRQMLNNARKALSRLRLRLMGRRSDAGYYISEQQSDLFLLDAMGNPIDVAFDTTGLRRMLEGADLDLLHLHTLGRLDRDLLPEAWRDRWDNLDRWSQIRISELIDPLPGSLSFVARKRTAAR